MTLQATTRRSPTYTGTGVSVTYSFAFKVFGAADVAVYVADTTGVETLLTGGYTVSLNVDQENSPGGGVALATPLASGFKLTIVGAVALSQPTDLPDGGSYRAQSVEDALDRAVMQIQQVDEKIGRAILLPVSAGQTPPQLPVPVPNSFIGWNGTADKLVNLNAADLVTEVAYGSTAVEPFVGTGVAGQTIVLADNPGSLSNVQLFAGGVAQRPGTDYSWDANRTITLIAAVPAGVAGFVRYSQALPIGQVADNSVTSSKIVDGAVGTAELADGAVGTAKLANGSVTADKLAASVLPALTSKIQPITASLSANALTVTLGPTALDFRSATLTDGVVNTRTIAAPLSLTLPQGSTLGLTAGVISRLVVLAVDVGGSVFLAVTSLANGDVGLDETGTVTTVAISNSSLSSTVVYASAAFANVPYRVVGFVEALQITPGNWQGLSLVQGAGGQAVAALSSLGYRQSWQDLTASRAASTLYYNTTGRPIVVAIRNVASGSVTSLIIAVNGVTIVSTSPSAGSSFSGSVIVPPGATYRVPTVFNNWYELR